MSENISSQDKPGIYGIVDYLFGVFNYKGQTSRKQYFWAWLVYKFLTFIVSFFYILDAYDYLTSEGYTICTIFIIYYFWITFMLIFRRLKDIGYSWKVSLIIEIASLICFLTFKIQLSYFMLALLCLPSNMVKTKNRELNNEDLQS